MALMRTLPNAYADIASPVHPPPNAFMIACELPVEGVCAVGKEMILHGCSE
jgi:hypothetical protein